MKIGLIVPGFSASEDDWCIPVLLNLVRALVQHHDVSVFALRYPPRRTPYSVYGARVHPFGGATLAGLARLPFLTRALRTILAQARQESFDVLHGLWADEPGFLAAVAARILNVPVLVSILGGELVAFPDLGYGGQLSRLNRLLTWVALRRADCVTVGSQYLRNLAEMRVSRHKLVVMPLGVDAALFAPKAESGVDTLSLPGTPRVLSVAALTPVKGHTVLLQVVALVAEQLPTVHLHLVGDGPLKGQLESLACELGIAARVTFHGNIRHDQLPAYYRAADLCVLSSHFESQGMVILEAAACGRATVGPAVGLLPELSPVPAAIPASDAEAYAQLLLEVLQQDGATLRNMGETSLQIVRSRYTLQHTMEQLTNLYESL